MASVKKISELQITNNLNEDDIHFLVIDKNLTNGEDASDTGKTSRVTLAQVRSAVESSGPKGQRGETGEKGPKGSDGMKGDVGDDGRKGPQGFQGDEGQKGEKGPSGEQGIQGIQGIPGVGDDGEKGQKGEQGEQGIKGETSSANSSLVLIASDNIKLDSTHNKISKISGGGAWNGNVISSIGFNTFNLSFGVNQTNKNIAIGVGIASSSELYDTDVNSIFLGFRFFNNGTYHFINHGKNVSSNPVPYRTNSVFSLSFDKINFTITQDGATIGSFGFEGDTPNITYAFDSAFYDVGTNLTEFISFTPGANSIRGPKGDVGQKGQKGQAGEAQKGQKGQAGLAQKGQKGELGVGQKGQKGASGALSNSVLERSNSNVRINTGSTSSGGIALNSSNNSKNFFQVYGTGTDYGFLNGDWSSWDIKKTKNSEMYLRIGSTNRKVYHEGNLSAVTTGNNTSLNTDSRNPRGVTRLYRRDSNSDYSVQTYWAASGLSKHLWRLHGYNGDSGHAGCQVEYADQAGVAKTAQKTTGMPSVTNPVNNNLIASGSSSKKSTVDITKYGIPKDSGARWGIFTTNMAGGSWPNHQVWVYSTTNWTKGNNVAANHSDKSQHNTMQYLAPIVNGRYCYINNVENSSDAWSTYFMGVV